MIYNEKNHNLKKNILTIGIYPKIILYYLEPQKNAYNLLEQ